VRPLRRRGPRFRRARGGLAWRVRASLVLGAVGPDQHGWSHDQAVAGRALGEAEQLVAVPAPGDPGLYGYQISTAFTAGSSLVARSDAATLVFIFFGVTGRRRARRGARP